MIRDTGVAMEVSLKTIGKAGMRDLMTADDINAVKSRYIP